MSGYLSCCVVSLVMVYLASLLLATILSRGSSCLEDVHPVLHLFRSIDSNDVLALAHAIYSVGS
jgi:sialic acid synthase SpsE